MAIVLVKNTAGKPIHGAYVKVISATEGNIDNYMVITNIEGICKIDDAIGIHVIMVNQRSVVTIRDLQGKIEITA
jgi:rRNA-processing protein FCF1